jgi:membrane-associated protease RseP (regulator of RpoE activity)
MPPFMLIKRLGRYASSSVFVLGIALPLGAQASGPILLRQRDSTHMRMPSRATIDSIEALMHALENEPPGSTASAALRRQIDSLLPGPQMLVVRKLSALPKGWVGFSAQGPKHEMLLPQGDFIQYFAYPSIVAVDPESPAQRAGIATGDVLIAYNGVDVRGREFNLSQLLEPDRKLSVTIRREGETKDYSMTVARAPQRISQRRLEFDAMPDGEVTTIERLMKGDGGAGGMPGMGRVVMPGTGASPVWASKLGMYLPGNSFMMSPNGAFGAILSDVNPALAKTLKLETGVLVNDVTDATPASNAGLHVGDVIVNAAGQPVVSLRILHELIARHLADQSIALQVMRDRKLRTITVNW